jgi:mRNA-degrading endonuclease RelE of RelBE toxin-antitoxin system
MRSTLLRLLWTIGVVICVTCKFVFLSRFDRAVKQLKKQYRQITADLEVALESIEQNPEIGAVIPRDYAVRKLRVTSRDMQRGKSGGFRCCTNWKIRRAKITSPTYSLCMRRQIKQMCRLRNYELSSIHWMKKQKNSDHQ